MLASAVLAGCSGGADADTILVLAASNLQIALPEIADSFTVRGGPTVQIAFASTGSLTTQLEQGAPADLFLAADEAYIDRLEDRGLVEPGERRAFAYGRIALVTAPTRGRVPELRQLFDDRIGTIAIANPGHAPFGAAAIDVFDRSGMEAVVRDRLVFGENVSQAYQYVRTGNADVGLVALSLVRADPEVAYLIVPRELHRPLPQFSVKLSASRAPAAAEEFREFLEGDVAAEIFQRHGFERVP